MGSWLKVNGDAIYVTHPWEIYGEDPTKVAAGAFHDSDTQAYTAADFRFTVKEDALYAIELAWPSNGEAVIHSFGANAPGGAFKVRAVSLLGHDGAIPFEQKPDGLHLHLPATQSGKYAFAYRILLDNDQTAVPSDSNSAIARR